MSVLSSFQFGAALFSTHFQPINWGTTKLIIGYTHICTFTWQVIRVFLHLVATLTHFSNLCVRLLFVL